MTKPRIGTLAALLLMGASLAALQPVDAVCVPGPDLCDDDLPPPEPCDPTGAWHQDWEECPTPPPCPPDEWTIGEPPEECTETPDTDPCDGPDTPCDPCDDSPDGCTVAPPCDPPAGGDCVDPDCEGTECVKDPPVDPCEGTVSEACDEECEGDDCGTTPEPPEPPCQSNPNAPGCREPCPGSGTEENDGLLDPNQTTLTFNNGTVPECGLDPCLGHVCDPCDVGGNLTTELPGSGPATDGVDAPSVEGKADYFLALTDEPVPCDYNLPVPLPLVPLPPDLGTLTAIPGSVTLEGDTHACSRYYVVTDSGLIIPNWEYEIRVVAHFNATTYRGDLENEVGTSKVVFMPHTTSVVAKTFSGRGYSNVLSCGEDRSHDWLDATAYGSDYYDWAQANVTYSASLRLNFVRTSGTQPYLHTIGPVFATCVRFDHDIVVLGSAPHLWAWEGFFPDAYVPGLGLYATVWAHGESRGVRPASEVGHGLCLPGGPGLLGGVISGV